MKFRTKIFIGFVSIAAASSSVGLFMNQLESNEFVASDLINTEVHHLLIDLLISFGVSLLLALILANILAQRVSRALNTLMDAAQEIGKGDLSYRIDVKTHDEFGALAEAMNSMAEGLEEKERLTSGFSHYVSQNVLDKIIQQRVSPEIGGRRRKITVIFSDIHDFKQLAKTVPTEQLISLLNEYFRTMIEIIFKYNGMLDKLVGDGISAEFGVPIEDPEQERNAVLTALEMQHTLKHLCERWKQEGKPAIELGIGIHTNETIVGTGIDDTVTVAASLENVSREEQYNIIISESTYKALSDEFESKHLGLLSLPGKELPVNAYAILGKKSRYPLH